MGAFRDYLESKKESKIENIDESNVSWDDCQKATEKVAKLFKGHSKITASNSLKIEVDGVIGVINFDPSNKF